MTLDLDPRWLEPQALDAASTLPARCYTDAQVDPLERERVFAPSWQLVAHAAQVAARGDHAIAEAAGVPLLVVRGDDGVLRALHNVCRHRAGPLATCDGRAAEALVCRYHGWTYALDGTLRGAPAMGRASGFRAQDVRLPAARVAEWQGLVFAAVGAAPPFAQWIDGVDARLADRDLGRYAFARRVSYEIGCDWKVYVDNYLEGYHLPQVHPELSRQLDTDRYATELGDWFSLQRSPLRTQPACGGMNDSGGGTGALYFWLYPNTMLNILPGRLQTNRVVPLGVGRCRVDFDYYYAPGVDAPAAAADQAFADRVQAEDSAICEAVQRGLASGSYATGRLNPAAESGLWHFHQRLRAAYRTGV
jgi:choline monooxygenase